VTGDLSDRLIVGRYLSDGLKLHTDFQFQRIPSTKNRAIFSLGVTWELGYVISAFRHLSQTIR
jgi:hypothetical protein